jgi:hypothetical protein
MPVKKVKGGYKVVSYVTGKTLKRVYKSRKAATRSKIQIQPDSSKRNGPMGQSWDRIL